MSRKGPTIGQQLRKSRRQKRTGVKSINIAGRFYQTSGPTNADRAEAISKAFAHISGNPRARRTQNR